MKYLILISIILAACAKSGDPSSQGVSSKQMAAVWSSSGAPNWTMDLSHENTGTPFEMTVSYLSGGSCQATANLGLQIDQDGDPVPDGTLVISSSQTLRLESGMAPCSMFDGTWTYNLYENSLVLCQGTSCVELK